MFLKVPTFDSSKLYSWLSVANLTAVVWTKNLVVNCMQLCTIHGEKSSGHFCGSISSKQQWSLPIPYNGYFLWGKIFTEPRSIVSQKIFMGYIFVEANFEIHY